MRTGLLSLALLLNLFFPTQLPALLVITNQPVFLTNPPFETNGLTPTGIQTDLAIAGDGWFVIRDPSSGTRFVTRRGDFRLDSEANLITAHGYRVQGFTDPSHTTVGDIKFDYSVLPASTGWVTAFRIATNGIVWLDTSDGKSFESSQILLQQLNRPEQLQRIYPDVMLAEADAEPVSTLQPPSSAGFGMLISGALSSEKLAPKLTLLPTLGKPKISDEGIATHTLVQTDLAIRGPGAFVVRDPATAQLFATRAGMFLLDRDGYLITYDHKRLQGLNPSSPQIISDIRLGSDLPPGTSPDAVMTYVSFDVNGDVNVQFSDWTAHVAGKIILYNFHRPDLLTPARLGQFSGVMAAQPYAVEDVGQYGQGKTRIEQGQLELVNVPRELLHLRQQLSFFSQGFLYRTTNITDLAIVGSGFFLLKHPLTGEQFVTRRGDFHLDASGHLVNEQSLRVQGFTDVELTQIGDVRITGRFVIDRAGAIVNFYSDGTQTNEGYVLIQMFKESYQLRPVGHGLYQNLDAAAPAGLVFAGTYGAGGVESSALESSPDPESLSLPDRRGTRMLITGEPGSRWIIQAKDGRSRWKTIGTIANAPFESEFIDRNSDRNQHRSYRVLAEYPCQRNQGW